jgi:Tol biopolymer transport system component
VHKAIMSLLLAVLGAVAVTSLTAPLWAARPPAAGKGIVFQARVRGGYQLFTIQPDGSRLTQVTHVTVRGSTIPGVELPAWSPDAKQIVFDSDFRGTAQRPVSLFTIAPDGGGLERVPLATRGLAAAPAYSPDGKEVSFDWDADSEPGHEQGIDVANANGTTVRRLTVADSTDAVDGRSAWSPNGKWIAFTELRGSLGTIIRVRRGGRARLALTPPVLDANNAAWSPDGRGIAFNSHNTAVSGVSANVYVMNPSGTGLHQLTHYKGGRLNAYMCDWSPDGEQIVFHVRGVDPRGPGLNQLFVMDADGRNVRQLTHLRRGRNPSYASWSPAG